jgi:hypothetical protein
VFLNVAETVLSAVMLTVQDPVPVQAPPQPMKVKPEPGFGVSVTAVPVG